MRSLWVSPASSSFALGTTRGHYVDRIVHQSPRCSVVLELVRLMVALFAASARRTPPGGVKTDRCPEGVATPRAMTASFPWLAEYARFRKVHGPEVSIGPRKGLALGPPNSSHHQPDKHQSATSRTELRHPLGASLVCHQPVSGSRSSSGGVPQRRWRYVLLVTMVLIRCLYVPSCVPSPCHSVFTNSDASQSAVRMRGHSPCEPGRRAVWKVLCRRIWRPHSNWTKTLAVSADFPPTPANFWPGREPRRAAVRRYRASRGTAGTAGCTRRPRFHHPVSLLSSSCPPARQNARQQTVCSTGPPMPPRVWIVFPSSNSVESFYLVATRDFRFARGRRN